MKLFGGPAGGGGKYGAGGGAMFDPCFLVLPVVLIATGLMAVYSSSVYVSLSKFGSDFHFFIRQLCYAFAAAAVYIVVLNVTSRQWSSFGRWKFMAAVLLLCVVVDFAGREINGARRWLSLGFVNIQPSEFAKLALIVFWAGFIDRHRDTIRNTASVAKAFLPLLLILVSLYFQKDMGTMAVLTGIFMLMFFMAGMIWKNIVMLAGLALAAGTALILMNPYRILRIVSYLDPFKSTQNEGYQLSLSLMALARGGLWGQGLGNSEIKLSYLPEPHTDFIMSIFGEEWGFAGLMFVLALELLLVLRAGRMGMEALRSETDRNYFHGFCAIGIAGWFGMQTLINVGVICGVFPTKGLTMPFISYGGTSLVSCVTATALLLRVSYERRLARAIGLKKAQQRQKHGARRGAAPGKGVGPAEAAGN